MKRDRNSKIIIIVAVIVAILATTAIILVSEKTKHYSLNVEPNLHYEVKNSYDKPIKNYRRLLCDLQTVQLPSAMTLGIEPMENNKSIANLVDKGLLVKVPNSKYLSVKVGYPYLIPEAYDMLLEIARRYQEKAGGHPHLRVTDCLRTKESIRELQKWNGNAVKNSCHLYGTTFDISYAYMDEHQKEACARVLKDMHDEGYLYAVYEEKQPCFHVTIRIPGTPKSLK